MNDHTLLPRVGRPPSRLGQPEDARFAFIRYQVLRLGLLLPNWWDGDVLLATMLRSTSPTDELYLPYLRYWVSKRAARTVVRQFDTWLEIASKFRQAHPEVRVPQWGLDTPDSQTRAEQQSVEAAMEILLDSLRLPKPPYPLRPDSRRVILHT